MPVAPRSGTGAGLEGKSSQTEKLKSVTEISDSPRASSPATKNGRRERSQQPKRADENAALEEALDGPSDSPISRAASCSPMTPPEKKKKRKHDHRRPSSRSSSPRRGGHRLKEFGIRSPIDSRSLMQPAGSKQGNMVCWYGRDCDRPSCYFQHPEGRLIDEGSKPPGKGSSKGGKDSQKGGRWGKGGKGNRSAGHRSWGGPGHRGSDDERRVTGKGNASRSRSRSRAEGGRDRRGSRKHRRHRRRHHRRRSTGSSRSKSAGRGRSSSNSSNNNRNSSNNSNNNNNRSRSRSGSRGKDGVVQEEASRKEGSPCVTFKSFVQQKLDPNVSPTEALKLFKTHLRTLREASWEKLRDTALAFDMYHPSALLRRYDWKLQVAKEASEDFLKNLQMGNFANISLVEPAGGTRQGSRCPVPVGSEAPFFVEDPTKFTLFIDNLPRTVSVYQDILDSNALTSATLKDFSVGKPMGEALLRSLRLVFRDEKNLEAAEGALKEKLDPACVVSRGDAAKEAVGCVLPPTMASATRLEKDKESAGRLIQKFDSASGVPPACTEAVLAAGPEDVAKALDLRILYLRRVHCFCYYLGRRFDDAIALQQGATAAVLRPNVERTEGTEGLEKASLVFEQSHDDRIARWLATNFLEETGVAPPNIIPTLDDASLAEKVGQFCEAKTEKVDEGKFKCLECGRMFKGPDYVSKHIRKVHGEAVEGLRQELLLEISKCHYFEDDAAPLLLRD